ncbi:unnamed protein product [Dovyalis caffra]|uniref:Uncharacterized protein n=1 Tax=Dovyalis caffra TaxID=77055 RepID=A0AAV1RMR5_9ROSI|nr:unnamed protein product [Dovyalis caffra]
MGWPIDLAYSCEREYEEVLEVMGELRLEERKIKVEVMLCVSRVCVGWAQGVRHISLGGLVATGCVSLPLEELVHARGWLSSGEQLEHEVVRVGYVGGILLELAKRLEAMFIGLLKAARIYKLTTKGTTTCIRFTIRGATIHIMGID